MKRILTLFGFLVFLTTAVFAQIGINNPAPTAALDVIGDIKVEGSLFLENPGQNNVVRGSKLLIQSTDLTVKQYDIEVSKYGPINYAQMVFIELSKDGLQDYDTKISSNDYVVSIQGYYFLEANDTDTNVMLRSTVDTNHIEGYQIYAYSNPVTNTWFIRAFGNNSEFMTPINNGNTLGTTDVDLYLNVIIYRKGFITKSSGDILVNMAGSETGTAPLPVGF